MTDIREELARAIRDWVCEDAPTAIKMRLETTDIEWLLARVLVPAEARVAAAIRARGDSNGA